MRFLEFKENKAYFIRVAGPEGRQIFKTDEDKARLLFLVLYLQSPIPIYNTTWYSRSFLKKGRFPTIAKEKQILKNRSVELLAFAILENELLLLVRNISFGAVTVYMHRALTSFAKYFNAKNRARGHVFAGPFFAEEIKDKAELEKKKNEITNLRKDGWSSHSDKQKNRWGELLKC